MPRRTAGKLLLALPAAVLPLPQEPEKPSAAAEFIASQQAGFSPEERERLKKNIGSLEKALAAIRGFPISFEVSPCLHFHALRSPGR
jgi:hypothetical protein